MTTRPNIVFLFTDDQRFDTVAALGNPEVRTPNLDRLVARGTSFTQAHIPSGMVGAVCMPSRAMLHTGRTLFHLDGAGESISPDHVLLGETLQHAGYAAFGTGKWHNGRTAYARSFTAGGEVMFGGMADHWNVPMCHWDPTGRYDVRHPFINGPFTNNRVMHQHVDHIHFGRHSTDIVCDHTIDFIRNHTGEPFFTYTSFLAPHDPRTMPEKYRQMYDPEEIELPRSFVPEHPFDYGQRDIRDEVLAPYPRTPAETRRHIAEYYAMITHLDDAVGKIIDTVEERGELENTIVVFAGDNGLACGRHGLMGKQNHYEHSIRVPLIFAGPGIPQGETRDTYAYLLDIYPTLCGLVGAEVPASVEGISLVPAIADPGIRVRSDLYFAYADLIRSAKNDRYKLCLYACGETNRAQLFDLADDPHELVNLLPDDGDPAHTNLTAITDFLYRLILRYRDEWDDRDSPWGRAFWLRFEENGGLESAMSRPSRGA
ncbi:MAG: choline-sulfatase [Spirochaetales bacterium]|nr:MAG: choline-sulfatase [Spirochaetales bacterium]